MLTKTRRERVRADGARFAIVASRYNARYVDAMMNSATATLAKAGAKETLVIRVPGAFEIPVIAAELARTRSGPRIAAIICLGVILRGETVHAAHIGEAVSQALMQIQINTGVPVIHEVLLLENERQAQARCLGKVHNRGTEAAHTALAMAELMTKLRA